MQKDERRWRAVSVRVRRAAGIGALLVLAVSFLGPVAVIAAQDASVDPVGARLHVAGPDVLFLDSLLIDGMEYNAYLARSADGTWNVTTLEPARASTVPQDVVLDFARLGVSADGALQITDVFLDGRFVSGEVVFDDALETVESYRFAVTDPPALDEHELIGAIAELYRAEMAPAAPAASTDEEPVDPAASTDEEPVDPAASTDEEPADLTPGPMSAQQDDPPTPQDEPHPPDSDGAGASPSSDDEDVQDVAAAEPDAASAAPTDIDTIVDRAVDRIVARLVSLGEPRLDRIDAAIAGVSEQVDRAHREGQAAVTALLDAIAAGGNSDDRAAAAESPATAERTVPVATQPEAVSPTLSLVRARAEMSRLETPDLTLGAPHRGTWEPGRTGVIRQVDPDARFAKLRLAYRQDSRPRLYRVLARALDDGWAGLGLHFAVDDVELPDGYGHGRSVLVWLTRDSAVYGVDSTYLEVYISYDDVNMDRVAQAMLDSDLGDDHALEVLVDPAASMLTVAVNGVEYFRYRLTIPRGAGMELALRALGRGEFRDLEVRRQP